VSITVQPVNDAPAATPQSVTTGEDAAKAIVLAGTDNETLPASLSFSIGVQPAHGSLSGTPPNVTYTPSLDYNGPDSFTFTATDRGDPDNCGAPVPGACTAALTSAAATVFRSRTRRT
jgi:Big-like domain-containing protein